MRRTPINAPNPTAAHDRFALDRLGVQTVSDLARDIGARTAERHDRANLPRVVGNLTDGSALASLIEALVRLGLLSDEIEGTSPADAIDSAVQVAGTLSLGALRGRGTTPSAAAGAAMGTSPSTITIAGTDFSGSVVQTAGTATTTGTMWTITFATPKDSASYRANAWAQNVRAAPVQLYTTNRTVNGFDISCNVAPLASNQQSVAWLVTDA